jgi:hypothetical protein
MCLGIISTFCTLYLLQSHDFVERRAMHMMSTRQLLDAWLLSLFVRNHAASPALPIQG